MKILRIKKSAEFKKISTKGFKAYTQAMLLISQKTDPIYFQDLTKNKNAADFCRVGFTVSKMVGGAVVRNKVKRRFREAFRALHLKYAKNHFDYVMIARKEAATSDYKKILKDLSIAFKKSSTGA